MLSGGKDSINMLYELVVVRKLKVLAYTVNHPFESTLAHSNIYRVLKKLNCEHVLFTPSEAAYKNLMRYVFTKDPQMLPRASLKMPCLVCGGIMKLLAFLYCYKMKIPYLLYCADPFQMLGLEATITETARLVLDVVGIDMLSALIEHETLMNVLEEDTSNLPRVVYPYATRDYNGNKIISRLKELEMYEGAPRATHCSLYTLLNYYSFTYCGNLFYAPELAARVRSGELSREWALNYIQMYKNILFNVLTKREKNESEKEYVRRFFQATYGDPVANSDAEACVEEEVQNALSFLDTLDEMNMRLEDIRMVREGMQEDETTGGARQVEARVRKLEEGRDRLKQLSRKAARMEAD
jgi:hypothetical protein